jgi:hypothetical protein
VADREGPQGFGTAGQTQEPQSVGGEAVEHGVQPVGEQGQGRTVGDLHEFGGTRGHPGSQVTVPDRGDSVGRHGHVEDLDAADGRGRGHGQMDQVPGSVLRLPPDRRGRLVADPPQIAYHAGIEMDDMQLGGVGTDVDIGMRPGHHGQHLPVRALTDRDDVPVTQPVDPAHRRVP